MTQYASGKSINAARALKSLAIPVICTGFVGRDNGEFLLADLDVAEIEHRFVRVDSPTRLCITVMDRTIGTATELIEESRAVGEFAYDQLRAVLEELLPKTTGVILSGSLTPGAPADFYSQCIRAAVAAGKTVVLDATGEPLRRALASRPTVIKPNLTELSQTVNAPVATDEQLKSAIRQLILLGPIWAVVTNGAKDIVASDGSAFWRVSTPKVAVVSPIGSGDSFAAGLMAGLTAGQSVQEACRLAAACGAANAMTAQAGFLKKSDVEELKDRVVVTEF